MGYVSWFVSGPLRHLGAGLAWERTFHAMFGRPCADSWFHNLLFTNNFLESGDMVGCKT